MQHDVRFTRRELGRGAIAGSGMRYGTNARCACGWEDFTNENPPSRSKSWQREVERRHTEQATPEWTLDWLRQQVTDRTERLTRSVTREGRTAYYGIESDARMLTIAVDKLTAEMREQEETERAAVEARREADKAASIRRALGAS